MLNKITIAAAVLLNEKGELLTVRKKNTSFYMLPGGKIEAGEENITTLLRELNEELSLVFKEEDFDFLGKHETQAANEANTIVEGNIFKLKKEIAEKVFSQAEIEEVAWLNKDSYINYKLAHLLKEFLLEKWLNNFN